MVNQLVPAGETPVPQGAPEDFADHVYRRAFRVPHGQRRVWNWLNDPATFTEGQVWPFKVEFVDGGFEPGVLNVHHGPLLNFAGAIGEVRDPDAGAAGYRDLKYFYGSYAISPRLVRPTRLQFWVEAAGADSVLMVQVDSLVRRRFTKPWDLLQRTFWKRFPRWIDSALKQET
ncbi:hypothetical protein BH24ACT22_BH24ACT22_16340 [soil metagenome]